jgi:hypothetical protein
VYDPDKTSYSMGEWWKEVNNIRTKTKIDDDITILKAGARKMDAGLLSELGPILIV